MAGIYGEGVVLSFRRGTETEWSQTNPVLRDGEPGVDITNMLVKVGDGETSWNSLSLVLGDE